MNSYSKKRISNAYPIVIILSALLAACNGGGSGDSEPFSDLLDDELQQQQPSDSTNGGLRGALVGTDSFNDFQPVRIDLSSGQRTSLSLDAVQSMIQNTQNFSLASNVSAITASDYSADASFLQIFPECNNRGANFFDDGCYGAFDSQFRSRATGVLNSVEVSGQAKPSRTGDRFVTVEYDPLDRDNSFMTIFNTQSGSTELRLSLPIDKTFGVDRMGAPAVEWGLNDELIYSNPATDPPSIFITEPGVVDIRRTINLPSRYSGIINDLHLSPTGKKLLITYERYGYVNGSFPMILDLDTLALTRPAVSETEIDLLPLGDNQSGVVMSTRGWSQDGNWIFVAYRNFNGTSLTGQTINPGTWHLSAVPATASEAVLSPDPSIATQGVISPLRYIDNRGRLVPIWGADKYNPIGVR